MVNVGQRYVPMPPPFMQLSLDEFLVLLGTFPFSRVIRQVHMHHTWRPNHALYRGHDTIKGMWRVHTVDRKFQDIAQHITIAPDGSIWTGRNWNWPPASSPGANGTEAEGPFMFETIGDFNKGRDPFAGPQRESVIRVITEVQRRFGLKPEDLRFHRDMLSTDCPGRAIEYEAVLEAVRACHEAAEAAEAQAEAEARDLGPLDDVLEEAPGKAPGQAPPDNAGDVPDKSATELLIEAWRATATIPEPEPSDVGCTFDEHEEQPKETENEAM